jgi:hypothetical protein
MSFSSETFHQVMNSMFLLKHGGKETYVEGLLEKTGDDLLVSLSRGYHLQREAPKR